MADAFAESLYFKAGETDLIKELAFVASEWSKVLGRHWIMTKCPDYLHFIDPLFWTINSVMIHAAKMTDGEVYGSVQHCLRTGVLDDYAKFEYAAFYLKGLMEKSNGFKTAKTMIEEFVAASNKTRSDSFLVAVASAKVILNVAAAANFEEGSSEMAEMSLECAAAWREVHDILVARGSMEARITRGSYGPITVPDEEKRVAFSFMIPATPAPVEPAFNSLGAYLKRVRGAAIPVAHPLPPAPAPFVAAASSSSSLPRPPHQAGAIDIPIWQPNFDDIGLPFEVVPIPHTDRYDRSAFCISEPMTYVGINVPHGKTVGDMKIIWNVSSEQSQWFVRQVIDYISATRTVGLMNRVTGLHVDKTDMPSNIRALKSIGFVESAKGFEFSFDQGV